MQAVVIPHTGNLTHDIMFVKLNIDVIPNPLLALLSRPLGVALNERAGVVCLWHEAVSHALASKDRALIEATLVAIAKASFSAGHVQRAQKWIQHN